MTPSNESDMFPTASQTAGPFFDLGFAHLCGDRVMQAAEGDRGVTVQGRVLDGNGEPIRDVALEIWQADPRGAYDPHGRHGFGRVVPNDGGSFTITTVRPGSVPGPGGTVQAPHLVVVLFMRGLLRHLVTRMYFPDDPRNDGDPILSLVPEHRRETLVARASSSDPAELVWDVVLQGAGETVFLEI
jgi:protocatechuate 3,4-dioxygenase, alpha subunit